MRSLIFLVALCGGAGSALASDPTFHYYVPSVPANNETCASTAAGIGRAFANITKVDKYTSRCAYDHGTSFEIDIAYTAPEKLNKVSTVADDAPVSGFLGSYRSREECERALPAETAEFTAQTGLSPVVHYCYPLPYVGSSHNYVQRIDSFGQPKNRFFTDEENLSGMPLTGVANVGAEVQANLLKQGVDVRRSFVRTGSGFGTYVTVAYYAPRHISFANVTDFTYDSPARCQSQVQEIRTALGMFQVEPLSVFCSTSSYGSVNILLAGVPFELRQHTWPYTSYEECYADRKNAIASYNQTHKLVAKTGVCAGSSQNFRLNFFVEMPVSDDVSTRASWVDANGIEWAPVGYRTTFGRAVQACRKMGYGLPGAEYLLEVLQMGLANQKINTAFGKQVRKMDWMWTGGPTPYASNVRYIVSNYGDYTPAIVGETHWAVCARHYNP